MGNSRTTGSRAPMAPVPAQPNEKQICFFGKNVVWVDGKLIDPLTGASAAFFTMETEPEKKSNAVEGKEKDGCCMPGFNVFKRK